MKILTDADITQLTSFYTTEVISNQRRSKIQNLACFARQLTEEEGRTMTDDSEEDSIVFCLWLSFIVLSCQRCLHFELN